jgi:hypothetical protein
MPQRLRRTIRGLEKLIDPVRYHFDDLEKQARRRPAGIDVTESVEVLQVCLANMEKELQALRERIDMELLLRDESLSEDGLPEVKEPLPGAETLVTARQDPISELSVLRERIRRALEEESGVRPFSTRAFTAAVDPFRNHTPTLDETTRTDGRSNDDTLMLKPVDLNQLDLRPTSPTPVVNPRVIPDRSGEETLILHRPNSTN